MKFVYNRGLRFFVAVSAAFLILSGPVAGAQDLDRHAFFAVPDFQELPPDIEVVSEITEEGIKITELYFTGAPFNGAPTRIYGFYCRPEAAGIYPSVLEIHGSGGWNSRLKPDVGIDYAKNGFACFVMDWAGPSEKRNKEGWRYSEFDAPGNMARSMEDKIAYPPHGWESFGREVDGIRNGVLFARRATMFLQSRPEVNAEQLCVSGMSAGAHLTLLLLGVEPAYRAAAVKYGTGFIDDIRFGGYFGKILMTDRDQQEEWLAAFDPKHGLHDYRSDTLILSGTDDLFFWMPAVLQTSRSVPTDNRLIMRPNDNHSQVSNTEIPQAWFRAVLGQTPAWPTIKPLTASVMDGQLTLKTKAEATPGIDHVKIIYKRQPVEIFYWGPKPNNPEKSAKWMVEDAGEDGGIWSITLPAPEDGEQLVAYATAYDKLGREVSSDTFELPDYPAWRGNTFQPWELEVKATDYTRFELTDPSRIGEVRTAGNLSGIKRGVNGHRVTGWFEYDITVPHSGWYELIVPYGGSMEYFVGDEYTYNVRDEKVGNFYLDKRRHTIRLQRYHYTGLSAVESFTLRAVPPENLAGHLRITPTDDRKVRRMGEDMQLRVQSGRLPASAQLELELLVDGEAVDSKTITLTDWPSDDIQTVSLACSRPGKGRVQFRLNGQNVASRDVPPIRFDIMDTTLQPATGGPLKRTLIQEIDCAVVVPDYAKGETQVVPKPFGAYRESGAVGWLAHMNADDPTWFAYTITVPEKQVPYIIEVDYPDDSFRTFCIAIREAGPGAYPSTAGVDSGGEWSLSNEMQTESILYWPRSNDLRVVLIPAHDGRRAAASRIRVYKVDGELPLLPTPKKGGRHFANWYEEGSNFRPMFGGAKNNQPSEVNDMALADRWARTMRYMGGDTLWMTMVVYQFGLYPSRYNVNFNGPYTDDMVGKVLLACERYGMDFIGEFHPEANELNWPKNADVNRLHLAINRNGEFRSKNTEPIYNPLWPANREWYLGMIGEFVDKYAESPALRGVDLRTMTWCNPGLSNFHNIEWGYDDYTIRRFVNDTGIQIPVDPGSRSRFRERYDWLMVNAREAWIDWRCEQIAEIYREAVARVRQARPDLVVVTGLTDTGDTKEAGLDPKLLAPIEGLVLHDATVYGRQKANELDNQKRRDRLIDPVFLKRGMPDPGQRMAYRHGSIYFEAPGMVLPPEDLGFPANTPRSYMSGVVNPAGRHALERWAVTLAETDTHFLADGGNAYTIGRPILREFLAEYRNLPALPFTSHPGATDPVAVWYRELLDDPNFQDGLYAYAVNRERYPVNLAVKLKGAEAVVRLSNGSAMPAPGGSLELILKPYELIAFRATPDTTIASVNTVVPEDAIAHAQSLVSFLEKNAAGARDQNLGVSLREEEIQILTDRAATARRALDAGHYWRARTMVEHLDLLRVYERLNRQPPNLRDMGLPIPPDDAMLPRQLQEHLLGGKARLAQSRELVPEWVGSELIVSTSEVLEFSIPMPVDGLKGLEFGRVAGEEFGDIELSVNGKVVGFLGDTGPRRGIVSRLDGVVLMHEGENHIRLRCLQGAAMALQYLWISPVNLDITANYWLAAGPFMVGDSRKLTKKIYPLLREAMETPDWQILEANLDVDEPFTLPDGSASHWQPFTDSGDFMDFSKVFDRNLGCISYAVTHIQSPADSCVRLSYGMDYWIKIWLNGEVVQDYAPHGGPPFKGQFNLDLPLHAGSNELLVKVASGKLGNGFWMAVSDNGQLTFSPRPPEG